MSKLISQREVIRRYNRMMIEHSDKMNEGKFNNYNCNKCNQITKTVDAVEGTTPMKIICPNCHGAYATSTFYKDRIPNIEPKYFWYRPTLKFVIKNRKRTEYINHILAGGLDFAEIPKKNDKKED